MSHQAFLRDRHAVRTFGDWLIELYPKNPSGVVTPLRFSRRGSITGSAAITIGADTIPAHTPYRKRVLQAPNLSQSLWQPGRILSSSLPSFGNLHLTNKDGGLDQYRPVNGWVWSGCRYKSFFGDARDLPNTLGKTAEGIMGDPEWSLSDVTIPLNGLESLFDVPISSRKYRGTSFALELSGDRTVTYSGTLTPINITGNMALEGWIWLEAKPSVDRLTLWGWSGTVIPIPWRWGMKTTGQMTLNGYVGGVSQTATSTIALSTFTMYQFAVVVSGRDVIFEVWNDDAQTLSTETITNAFSSATRDSAAGGNTYFIRTAADAAFKPWFDEMRVWNVARSKDERESYRFRPLAGSVPASCVHCVGMDDGSGTTVTDSSASALHGAISGGGTSTWLWMHEGGPELAGTPKPDVWGERFGVAPVLVHPVGNGYQVAGGGVVNGIASYEGGNPHTMDASASNFRTYITTTPTAGRSLPYLPRGLFKLGTIPTLPISAKVNGYSGGPLGYVNKGGTITRDVITRRGPKLIDPTQLDTAAFTAYNTANPAIVGVFISDSNSRTIHSVNDFLMASGAGWWGYVRASVLFHLRKFAGPSATPDFIFNQTRIVDIKPLPPLAVIYKVIVKYRENNVVLSEDQVAAAVKATPGWQSWTRQWLEESSSDDAIQAAYPGSASIPLTIETGLQYAQDAKALADYLLEELKGPREGYQVVLDSVGYEATIGQSIGLEVILQDKHERLNLDGDGSYEAVDVNDNRQGGTVAVALWG